MCDNLNLVKRQREIAEASYKMRDAIEADFHKQADINGRLLTKNAELRQRITELEDAFREIYEVYAGSEGFIPETCPEAYQQQLIKEMSDIAARHMRKGKE